MNIDDVHETLLRISHFLSGKDFNEDPGYCRISCQTECQIERPLNGRKWRRYRLKDQSFGYLYLEVF